MCCFSVWLRYIGIMVLELTVNRPVWARQRCWISPPRFLAECCKRQLNQGSFVLLYFRLFTFSDLYWVCLSVFSCTVSFVSIRQVIGCEDRLRNDLYCVEWGIKLYANQPLTVNQKRFMAWLPWTIGGGGAYEKYLQLLLTRWHHCSHV